MMTAPKISIVMPVWNGEKYLREAVDGIIAQTFSDFELLVLDDGSTDSTPDILSSFRDPRIRTFRLAHGGCAVARNIGVTKAQGEWIAPHDADDISHPLRLQKQWDAVHRRPSVVFSYTGMTFAGDVPPGAAPGRVVRSRALLAMKLCYMNPFVASSVLFRKTAFEATNGYDQEKSPSEDFSLFGELIEMGDAVGVPDALVKYRVHAASLSRTNAVRQRERAAEIAQQHCHRFMQLSSEKALRAFNILRTPSENRSWSEWLWFLRHCVPRLRWKSAELYAWLGSQTVRVLLSKPRQTKPEMV